MNIRTPAATEAHALRASRQQAAELLSRYPNISKRESAEVLLFLRTGRHLDIGMLTSNKELRPKLDAFVADHKRELGVGFGEAAGVIAGIAAVLTLCWLVWEVIGPSAAV